MKNKIRGAQMEVIEDVQQWTAQSGTRCASLVATIKGEEGLFKIIFFKEQVDSLIKGDLLHVGKKIKADLSTADSPRNDYIATRIYRPAPIKTSSAVFGGSEGADFSKADEIYGNMGYKKSYIKQVRGKVWAFLWE